MLVLCSVFVPVAFIGGVTGAFFKQFAMTIVIAVVLSGIVALTLTPALCALLLKDSNETHTTGFFGWFNRVLRAWHEPLCRRRRLGARSTIGLARRVRCAARARRVAVDAIPTAFIPMNRYDAALVLGHRSWRELVPNLHERGLTRDSTGQPLEQPRGSATSNGLISLVITPPPFACSVVRDVLA